MSEKSKGDTSAQIKNNPLLSASVTGMLLDHFPNKPLLLPAAPIVIKPVPAVISTDLQTSTIDGDQFSEINLADDPVPLQSDLNDNPFPQIQHEPLAHHPSEFADESILSQAASSFSQLPSVASTVLSTFSKVINNYTPNRDINSETDSVQHLQQQQQYHQQQQQQQQQSHQQYPQTLVESEQFPGRDLNYQKENYPHSISAPIDPPRFFLPSDYTDNQNNQTIKSTTPQLPPPLTAGTTAGNTYRLTTKKKTYAQIPGLSSLTSKQVDQTNQNFLKNNFAYQSPSSSSSNDLNFDTSFSIQQQNDLAINQNIDIVNPTYQQKSQPEEKKSNSLFSFANIVPPVLQNLSGFVKSTVVGSSEQLSPAPPILVQQSQASFDFSPPEIQQQQQQQQHNFTINATTPGFVIPEQQPLSPANFFTPALGNSASPSVAINQIGFGSIQNTVEPSSSSSSIPPPTKPPAVTGGTSFRLQKGTRSYKSPFESGAIPSAPSIQAVFSLEPTEFQAPRQAVSGNFQVPPSEFQTLPPAGSVNFPPPPLREEIFTPPAATGFFQPPPLLSEPNIRGDFVDLPTEFQAPPAANIGVFQHSPLSRELNIKSEITTQPTGFQATPQVVSGFFQPPPLSREPNIKSEVLTSPTGFQAPPPAVSGFFQTSPLLSGENIKADFIAQPTEFQGAPPNISTVTNNINSEFLGNPTDYQIHPSLPQYPAPTNNIFNPAPNHPILTTNQEEKSLWTNNLPLPPEELSVDATQIFPGTENTLKSLGSVPNFPPPPAEESPSKEDQYDSIPIQPPSIEQKPIEPLLKKSPEPNEDSNIIFFNAPPTGLIAHQKDLHSVPPPQVTSFQQASNPFRRGSGSSLKSTKSGSIVVPPQQILFPSQIIETAQPNTPTFFEPQQLNEIPNSPNVINSQNIYNNSKIEPLQENYNLSSIPGSQTNDNYLPSENCKQIENLYNNTSDPIKILKIEKDIVTAQICLENFPTSKTSKNSNLSNYFDNKFDGVSTKPIKEKENNFCNVVPLSSNAPQFPNIISTVPEISEVTQFTNFENKLKNNFDELNLTENHQSQAVFNVNTFQPIPRSSPGVTNFFNPIDTNQIFSPPPPPVLSPKKSEENFNNSQKSTPEKVANLQQNLFTNYFQSNQQQQINQKQSEFQNPPNIQLIKPTSVETIQTSDPLSFFDSFVNKSTKSLSVGENLSCGDLQNQTSEDPNSQRIQNFFNNPPPQDLGDSTNDLNYNFYGGSEEILVQKKDFLSKAFTETNRSITPASNLVEPPSSACSEFSSDLNNLSGQQIIIDSLKKITVDDLPDELAEQIKMASVNPPSNVVYHPATKHWFYKQTIDGKQIWTPFSHKDSEAIENSYKSDGPEIIAVEGGRYDVNINDKTRTPVYWTGDQSEVRRCSWFYKSIDSKYIPYDETTADLLEEEYKNASNSGEWHKKVPLATGEMVMFHGPTVIVHFLQSQIVDAWGGAASQSRPRVVKRDLEHFLIEDGETNKVDHLLFMVHGIGSVCDLKFRTVEEVVEDFRSIAYQLVQSHYKNSYNQGEVGRVEVLPVSWHHELHSKESGIDEKLKAITLESIPKLRNFANDTVLDVLFYTSPAFCQSIINTVANCMNRVYVKYCQRNSDFNGTVSIAGHSLGSIIVFDLLCHQKPIEDSDMQNSENPGEMPQITNQIVNTGCGVACSAAPNVHYQMGSAGTGQPFINYPQLLFAPKKFFALGSPIGMFVTIRGIDGLGLDFKLPTCNGFYNIFHPYDPVAYRIEALVNSELSVIRPFLIPHHKGRKRMHLELKETMTRVGTEVKQKLLETFKNTMESVFSLASKNNKTDTQEMEKEVDKVLEHQLKMDQSSERLRTVSTSSAANSDPEIADVDLPFGKLNNSKRIDYVLQEAPFEFFNEYLFALNSHVCYWESEDTILFVVKEIYSSLGINTDSQIPQQSMKIERPNSSNSLSPTS